MIIAQLPTAAWAGTSTGAYPELTPLGAGGSARFGVIGAPEAKVTSTSTRPDLSSGNSAFLGAQTPFGAEFGSSQDKPYYTLYTASGRAASVTTVTFEQPMPAGAWGFALGDVDADTDKVTATGPNGAPLPVSALGFRSVFEYCHNSPKPSACKNDKSNDDVPNWNAATGTLIGNGADTYGASGWFMPTQPVKELTLTYNVLTGVPAYQLWMAVRKTRITGCADIDGRDPLTGAKVKLLDAAGDPVATTNDGTYSFGPVIPARYRLSFTPPDGYVARGETTRTVDATEADPAKVPCFSATPAPGAPNFTVEVAPGVTTNVEGPLPKIAEPGTIKISSPPAHGTARVTGNQIKYRPHRGFRGTDHLGYCFRNKTGHQKCGRIKIVVTTSTCRIAELAPALFPAGEQRRC
jgi:hypothetical protein